MSFSFSVPLSLSSSTSNGSASTSALTTVKQNEEHFVCIPSALQEGPGQKSFEEVRIDDYLRFYQTKGHPPPPCPEEPKLPAERAALGLPPLFEPTIISKTSSIGDLPEWQTFTSPLSSPEGMLHNLSALNEYSAFSVEELRYHAYRKGKITPPSTIQMSPFTPTPSANVASTPSTTTTANGIQYGGDSKETFLSITSKPEYALHSFEELRCAFMQARREVTSSEILGGSAPVLASPTIPIPFATAPATPTPAAAPGFSFAFGR